MALVPVAIVPLYWRDDVGMTMGEIFSLQALFGLFVACLEFPGGFVADRVGYRSALGVATGFSVVGWIVMGNADSFWTVLGAELLFAFSLALTSGTDSAMLYESCVELGEEHEFRRWFGRSRSIGALSEGTAALVAGILYSVWAPLPFYLQAALWLLNGLIVLALVEPARHPPALDHPWQRVREIFALAAYRSPRLRASLVTVAVIGLSTFTPVWMVAVYASDAGVSAAWIGPIWAAANYCVALGNWTSDATARRFGPFATVGGCLALIALGLLGMGLSHAVWGFAFYFLVCLGRGLNGPIFNHMQQRLIPSSDRASLLSINSLLFRGGFFLLGPVLGSNVDRFGEHAVLLVLAATIFPLCTASLVWLRATMAHDPDPSEPTPQFRG